jgi:hypothetical protein
MSAMQQVLMAGDGLRLVVNVNVEVETSFGFGVTGQAVGGGSTTVISGGFRSSAGTPVGVCIMISNTGSNDFHVALNTSSGAPAQNFFNGVNVWDQSNTKRTYLTSAANYSTSAVCSNPTAHWTWGTSSNSVWTAGGVVRRVEFF